MQSHQKEAVNNGKLDPDSESSALTNVSFVNFLLRECANVQVEPDEWIRNTCLPPKKLFKKEDSTQRF